MNGQEAHAGLRHLRHGSLDRLGNIVELEVEEDVFALCLKVSDDLHAGSSIQFHADFVEVHAHAELRDQGARFGGGFDIECDDDGVVSHISSMGFSRLRTTRPMR